MASRSATVLVIFVIAVIAFCLASVFGAMTGPISIFPNITDDGGSILDNLSSNGGSGDTSHSYGNDNYNDYSSSSSDSSSSNVETTTDDSSSSDNQKPSEDSNPAPSPAPNVETTT
ncbi:MAG: hypothetical protein ACSW71_06665 [Methanobrevibacter sp.]